ncbi:MAG: hypothetical protein M1833_007206 [Piccolia ochrophora]|nr:MAG: hypothetical protein M1833_007206 [Piccolia ochrophora]
MHFLATLTLLALPLTALAAPLLGEHSLDVGGLVEGATDGVSGVLGTAAVPVNGAVNGPTAQGAVNGPTAQGLVNGPTAQGLGKSVGGALPGN